MHVAALGEFGLIDRLARRIGAAAVAAEQRDRTPFGRLAVGIGDDAAVWDLGPWNELATTDTLVAGVHFLADVVPWRHVGWKALAVNLSDIAAMGGTPGYAMITLGLPQDTPVAAVDDLYEGLLAAATRFGTALVGGDIVRSPVHFVTVALVGWARSDAEKPLLLRSAAKPGDLVAVTGLLGAAAGAVPLVRRRGGLPGDIPDCGPADKAALLAAYGEPQPRVAEGPAFRDLGVRAAIDVSDGLLADLGHLCKASGVAAVLQELQIPVHPVLPRLYGAAEALRLAMTGGEDYELLFTASPAVMEQVVARPPCPLSIIGEIVSGTRGSVSTVDASGQQRTWDQGGWDHLRA